MGTSTRIYDLLLQGGFIMWPLFILMTAATVLFIRGFIIILKRKESELSEIPILDFIAHISPVLGFLGTVIGMISAFRSISYETMVHISIVAGGMYEALYTTAFGLIVSIAATLASFILEYLRERVCEDETDT